MQGQNLYDDAVAGFAKGEGIKTNPTCKTVGAPTEVPTDEIQKKHIKPSCASAGVKPKEHAGGSGGQKKDTCCGMNDSAEKTKGDQTAPSAGSAALFTGVLAEAAQGSKPKITMQEKFNAAVDGIVPAIAVKKFKQILNTVDEDADCMVGYMTACPKKGKKHTRLLFQKLVAGHAGDEEGAQAVVKHFKPNHVVRAVLLPADLPRRPTSEIPDAAGRCSNCLVYVLGHNPSISKNLSADQPPKVGFQYLSKYHNDKPRTQTKTVQAGSNQQAQTEPAGSIGFYSWENNKDT